ADLNGAEYYNVGKCEYINFIVDECTHIVDGKIPSAHPGTCYSRADYYNWISDWKKSKAIVPSEVTTVTAAEPPTVWSEKYVGDMSAGKQIDFQAEFRYNWGIKYDYNANIFKADSLEELMSVINYAEVHPDYPDGRPYINGINEKVFNESFFEEKSVILLYYHLSDTGRTPLADSVIRVDNALIINTVTGRGVLELGMAYSINRLLIVIDRDDLSGVDSFYFTNEYRDFVYEDCVCKKSGSTNHSSSCWDNKGFKNWVEGWKESKAIVPVSVS
ncbi:MAG: hypothetical protein FWF82_05570, partial [Oscillospiraceae bacterium]|nr:hypothetical protein [Oscillospiraceae bacterium]